MAQVIEIESKKVYFVSCPDCFEEVEVSPEDRTVVCDNCGEDIIAVVKTGDGFDDNE